jgi:hypothetical protein
MRSVPLAHHARNAHQAAHGTSPCKCKREAEASLFELEREKSLELSTSTLARLRSTN